MRKIPIVLALLSIAAAGACTTSRVAGDTGFVPLFNGRDLSGWVNINTAPDTWSVTNGVIHCTGQPIGAMRTQKHYENFVLELEWRHLKPAGNSGLFIWSSPAPTGTSAYCKSIEVQILDHQFYTNHVAAGKKAGWFTTDGDVFAIQGAAMQPFEPTDGRRSFPRESRTKSSPAWNHYCIAGSNGILTLAVNGAVVSGGSNCVWRKGYICLESEGSPIEFRNLRIKEIPTSHPKPDEIAPLAE
ncbi:MAG: DUF1080 domain-containing protein [Verrucomicrobia bacterium]|nr:DUF1080 domain-containing protein [Verrucomicrobiota bacterium]